MANPPNQTMRTTVETTVRTFGTDDLADMAKQIQNVRGQIGGLTNDLSVYAKQLVETEMIQTRKAAKALGIVMPKQVVEGVQRIASEFDPNTGEATKFVNVGYKISERMPGEIAKAAERQLRGRGLYAGLGSRAGGVQALRDVLAGMSGTPLAGGAAQALVNINQAVSDVRGTDEAAAAQSLPLIKLINQNKKLFGRLARGGYAAGGAGDEVKALLAKDDVAGAIERMRQADIERGTEKEAMGRSRAALRVARSLSAQEARIEHFKSQGIPSYLTGGTTASGLEAIAQTIRAALRKPDADVDEAKFLTDSLKENIDEVNSSTKTYKSAAEAVQFLDDAISKLGALMAGPGGAVLSNAAIHAKAAFVNEEQLRQAGLGAGTGFQDAARLAAGGKETVKQIQDRVRDQIKDLRREGTELRGKAQREDLTKRYARHPDGSAAAARMTSSLEKAEIARRSGATTEAELHEAEAGRAQADLELIERRIAKDRYARMRTIGGMKRFSGQAFGLGASAISGDVAGLGGAGVGMVGNTGQLLTTLAAPSIIKNGFAGAGFGANAMFFGGMALAGVGSLASAAYGRGASFLNRADAAAANFLPAYEGFATANRSELAGSFSSQQMSDMLQNSIMQSKGYSDFELNRESSPGFLGFSADVFSASATGFSAAVKGFKGRGWQLIRDQKEAAEKAAAVQLGSGVLSADEQASLAQQMRRRVQDQVFENFGTGKGNVSLSQISEALSASGRGFGTEFNVGARPAGMTAEMFGAGSAAAYANMRGLSVASVARLSSLGARFGVSNYSEVPGLVGVGGFGFRGGARDSFIDTINERVSAAALGGETPELAMRNRLYQGAVGAGGDKEQLANAYASSIGNMGDFRRGLFKGAADFSKKLMLTKAVSTGGSLQAADDLLADQGAGFTEMDRLSDAMRLSPFMADAEMRYEGLSRKTREALKTSAMSGGGTVSEEPVAPESFFNRGLEATASEAEAASERTLSDKKDMANIAASFDKATARFSNAVQRFAAGILR